MAGERQRDGRRCERPLDQGRARLAPPGDADSRQLPDLAATGTDRLLTDLASVAALLCRRQTRPSARERLEEKVGVELARRLRAAVREADIAWRIGGDEFAIVLPESTIQDAERLHEVGGHAR